MVTLTHYYDSIRLNISQGDPVGHWCAAFNIEVRINCEKFKVMNKSVWVCVCVCVCFHMWWFFLRWQQVWDHSDPSLKGQYVITSKCDRASNSLPILCAINILTCKTLICSDSGEMRRASPRLWKKSIVLWTHMRHVLLQLLHALQGSVFGLGILQKSSDIKHIIQVCLDLNLQLITLCVL